MLWSSYLSGLVLGLGVCTLHCALLLLPMTARLNTTWRGGVRTAVLFGAGKSLALSTYGGLAVILGFLVYDLINNVWVSFAAGIAVAGIGVWFLLHSGSCGGLARKGSPFVLGLIDGAVPCPATTGFLLFLATQGLGFGSGMLHGLIFGLGTAIGPLLILCGLMPRFWRRLSGARSAQLALRAVGSAVLFLWAFIILTRGLT